MPGRLPRGLPMRKCFSEWNFFKYFYEIQLHGPDPIIPLRKREEVLSDSDSGHHILRGEAESARYGAKSVAVPGEAAGYWEAKQKYGQ